MLDGSGRAGTSEPGVGGGSQGTGTSEPGVEGGSQGGGSSPGTGSQSGSGGGGGGGSGSRQGAPGEADQASVRRGGGSGARTAVLVAVLLVAGIGLAVLLYQDRTNQLIAAGPRVARVSEAEEEKRVSFPAGYVFVTPGCFQMGSPSSEDGRSEDEEMHEVCVTRGYFLKETEVTQGEWTALMGSYPSYFTSCGSDCPVERVSWFEAVAYANALSKKEGLEQCYTVSGCSGALGGGCGSELLCDGDYECSDVSFNGLGCKGYRLPTEAEWEFAARAGSRTSTYAGELKILGDNIGRVLDEIAWHRRNSGVSYSSGVECIGWNDKPHSASTCGTHAVRQKRPNAWGFYDLLGNVLEWTWDWYGDYGGTSDDPLGASRGSDRVGRGGSWLNNARIVRAANRSWFDPGLRTGNLGFRLCRSQ